MVEDQEGLGRTGMSAVVIDADSVGEVLDRRSRRRLRRDCRQYHSREWRLGRWGLQLDRRSGHCAGAARLVHNCGRAGRVGLEQELGSRLFWVVGRAEA